MKALTGKNILMVLDSHFPPDLRVSKEASALIEAGASLTLVCYRNEGQAREEVIEGIKIHRTTGIIRTREQGFIDMANTATGVNFSIRRLLTDLEGNFDAVHIHDLPVFSTVRKWAAKKEIPVVLDMHENYPEGIATWFEWRSNALIRLKNKLFFNPSYWYKRERKAVIQADRIITVVEEMKERIVQRYGIPASKVHVVRNSEPSNLFGKTPPPKSLPSDANELVYVGGIGPHRGLDTAVEAMALLRKDLPRLKLAIVGSGNRETVAHLEKLTTKYGVNEIVQFTGQLPPAEARNRMHGALLNIIPHHKNGQNESGLPHKLFQIMLSGYPLLVSSCRPLQRIIGDNQAGLVFEAGNAADFAEKVRWADSNRAALHSMANKAWNMAVNGNYNWEEDARILVEIYRNSM